MSSTPTHFPRSISGTASSDLTLSMALMYRGSFNVSLTRTGCPVAAAVPLIPWPERDAKIFREIARVADGETMLQVGSVALEHQHAKDLVVDVAFDQHSRARQHLVQIERGINLFADFG